MSVVYLSLGTNIGNRLINLSKALTEIRSRIGEIIRLSPVYESASWGFESENFLNQVICIDTVFNPDVLIQLCLAIEQDMGRIRGNNGKYTARNIDIDVLFYNDLIIKNPNLNVPHPYIEFRRFILVPLCQIAPDLVHPVLQKSILCLLNECTDNGIVTEYEG